MRLAFAVMLLLVLVIGICPVAQADSDTTDVDLTAYVCALGDANGDSKVNTGDITKIKRIYFGIDVTTPCADANQDDKVNSGDITMVKRIYFGLED